MTNFLRVVLRISLLVLVLIMAYRYLSPKPAPQPGDVAGIDNVVPPSPQPDLGEQVVVAPEGVDVPPVAPAALAEVDAQKFGIDKFLLERVLDKTRGIPQRPYFHLIDIASRTPIAELLKAATGEDRLTYANLWMQPEQNRGALVRLTGTARGAVKFDVSQSEANTLDQDHLFQADLFTSASHPRPYILIVPELPANMPTGIGINERIEFVGFFLKLWRYESAAGVDRAAPLLIGRIVKWTQPIKEDHSGERLILGGILLTLLAGVVTLIWVLQQRGRQPVLRGERSQVMASLESLEKRQPEDPAQE